MQFNWMEMWQHMGAPAIAVALVLLLMGLASLTVLVERLLTFRRSRAGSRAFAARIGGALESGHFEAVLEVAPEFEQSHLARVIRTGIQTFFHAERTAAVAGLSPLEQTQRHMERYMEEIGADLRRGLSVLASVGSTAPFVGLLGTVLGIISAFQGIASSGSGGLSSVSAGISEALIETALGLTVAIPAVLAFNFLSTRLGAEEMRLKNAAGELLDRIEDWAERRAVSSSTSPAAASSRTATERVGEGRQETTASSPASVPA